MRYLSALLVLLMAASAPAQQTGQQTAQQPSQPAQQYDLLLRGGHVIDARNRVSAVRDVAIKDGRIAAVAVNIDPAAAFKAIDVSGLYVTPGLVDLHVHVFAGAGEQRSYAGDL